MWNFTALSAAAGSRISPVSAACQATGARELFSGVRLALYFLPALADASPVDNYLIIQYLADFFGFGFKNALPMDVGNGPKMTDKIKEWISIGGLILLGALAMAGWSSHEKPAAPVRSVSTQQKNPPPPDKKHNGSIGALSAGRAGFVK